MPSETNELRNLKEDEFEASARLAEYAFQYKLDPEALEEQRARFRPEQLWGVFGGGKLEAQLKLLSLQMYLNGSVFDMGGIAFVSTWPEYRRQGHVARLLEHALRQMRENGQSISCLAPFSFGFYRKFGWEILTDLKKYTVETANFPPRTAFEGHVAIVEPDIAQLSRLYEKYAARFNGTLRRDEQWWKESVFRRKLGYAAVYCRPDGEAAGYMLYQINQRVLTVTEMICEDFAAYQALWTYIANHDSMIEKVVLTAPMDEALPYLLANPRIIQEVEPYFMARIVDAAAFIGQFPFAAGEAQTEMDFELTDRYAPWNEGRWTLSVDRDGQGRLHPAQGRAAADLACDIGALTAMMTGYLRPSALHRFGRLQGSPEAVSKLETLIPPRLTYLLDFF